MSETTFIYGLLDPRTKQLRYVGKANNPNERFKEHLVDRKINHRTNWVKRLLAVGAKPELVILQEVPRATWEFWEQAWISSARANGANLVNTTDGGKGGNGYIPTNEVREKKAVAMRRLWESEEYREQMAKTLIGREVSAETRRKIGEANKISKLGKKASEETKLKMSATRKGKKMRPFSEQARKNMSDAHIGHVPTNETRRKLSEATRATWAKRRQSKCQNP